MKIGMTLSHADLDTPLAEHFGKAKWLAVVDGERCELFRNAGLDGRSVAEDFARRGCTDVVADHLGPGAHAHVTAAGMRIWKAEPGASARALAKALEEGRLRPLGPESVHAAHGHHGAHGHG